MDGVSGNLGATGGPALGPALVATLYQQHYASLCRTARLLVDDPGKAEELVQDAFVRTLSGPRVLRQPEAAAGYLRRAVVHACRSELRRRRVERRFAGRQLVSGGGRHFAELVGERDAVARVLGALPPRQREAVVLRYYADLDEAGIAEVMRCSVGTVKSQLAKARRHLSVLLDREGGRP